MSKLIVVPSDIVELAVALIVRESGLYIDYKPEIKRVAEALLNGAAKPTMPGFIVHSEHTPRTDYDILLNACSLNKSVSTIFINLNGFKEGSPQTTIDLLYVVHGEYKIHTLTITPSKVLKTESVVPVDLTTPVDYSAFVSSAPCHRNRVMCFPYVRPLDFSIKDATKIQEAVEHIFKHCIANVVGLNDYTNFVDEQDTYYELEVTFNERYGESLGNALRLWGKAGGVVDLVFIEPDPTYTLPQRWWVCENVSAMSLDRGAARCIDADPEPIDIQLVARSETAKRVNEESDYDYVRRLMADMNTVATNPNARNELPDGVVEILSDSVRGFIHDSITRTVTTPSDLKAGAITWLELFTNNSTTVATLDTQSSYFSLFSTLFFMCNVGTAETTYEEIKIESVAPNWVRVTGWVSGAIRFKNTLVIRTENGKLFRNLDL